MIKIILLLLITTLSFSLNDVTVPNTFATGEKIYASQFNQNFDSIETWAEKLTDSLDDKFIRFTDISSGDSVLTVDTLYGRAGVWTGITLIDSLVVTKQIQGDIKGNIVGDVTGNITGNVTGSISGGTIAGSTGTFTGTVIVDSLKSTKQVEANLKGNVTGNVTGNVSGTAATVTTAAQPTITSVGTLTGLTVNGATVINENSADVDFRVESDTTENMIFADGQTGFVGIGTNLAENRLTLAGGSYISFRRTINTPCGIKVNSDNGADFSIAMHYSSLTGVMRQKIAFLNEGSYARKAIVFYTTNESVDGSGEGTERMRIASTGYVGIGTDTPTEKLHVSSGNIKTDTLKGAVQGNVAGNVTSTRNNLIDTITTKRINITGDAEGINFSGNGNYISSSGSLFIFGDSISTTSSQVVRSTITQSLKIGSNGTGIDSIKVISGGANPDTLKLWLGNNSTPFKLVR